MKSIIGVKGVWGTRCQSHIARIQSKLQRELQRGSRAISALSCNARGTDGSRQSLTVMKLTEAVGGRPPFHLRPPLLAHLWDGEGATMWTSVWQVFCPEWNISAAIPGFSYAFPQPDAASVIDRHLTSPTRGAGWWSRCWGSRRWPRRNPPPRGRQTPDE